MHIIISLQNPFTGSPSKNNADFWLAFTELLILYIYTYTHAHPLHMCPEVNTHMHQHSLILIAAHFMDKKLYDYITVQGYSHAKCSSQNTNVWVQSPCTSTINHPAWHGWIWHWKLLQFLALLPSFVLPNFPPSVICSIIARLLSAPPTSTDTLLGKDITVVSCQNADSYWVVLGPGVLHTILHF